MGIEEFEDMEMKDPLSFHGRSSGAKYSYQFSSNQ